MGLLTSPQAISFCLMGSLTMVFEEGDRLNHKETYPVLVPEKATKAPESAIKLALVLGSAGV